MVKKFLFIAAMTLLCTHITAGAENDLLINVDGTDRVCSNAPYILNDCTMIYYEDIADILGVYINWDEAANLITVGRFDSYSGDPPVIEYTMTVNEPYIIPEHGSAIKIDVPAVVTEGRLYLPLRAVSEKLNAVVEWNEDRNCAEIKTEGNRTLLNGRFHITLPVYVNAYDIASEMVMDDGSTNTACIFYKSFNSGIRIYAWDLFKKTTGDIEADAECLGYTIDPDKTFRNNEIEAVCERDLITKGHGRILIKMRDDFLIEFSCDINSSESKERHYQEITEEILSRVQTITNGEKSMDLSAKTVTFYYGRTIVVPKDYLAYEVLGDTPSMHIIKPVSADKDCPSLSFKQTNWKPDNVIKTIESSYLGRTIVWNICDNGTAYADAYSMPIWESMYIRNANEEEILEFIEIAKNITYKE